MTTADLNGTESASVSAPEIDVVILNYNYARFVGDAITSALAQTDPFQRIVVVNDGSTDDSLAVIGAFGDRVKIVDKPNGGQISASMAGLTECAAEYVCFLDADDYLLETAVETIRPWLRSHPVKAQFQLIGVDANRKPIDSLFPVFPAGYGSAEMQIDNREIGFYTSSPTSANIYLRSFLETLDLASLDQRDSIDGVPNLVAPYKGEVVSVNAPTGFYRVHDQNFSQWRAPTVELLTGEIAWLGRRWQQAERLMGGAVPVPDLRNGLYTLERELMVAALEPDGDVSGAARRFVSQLSRTRTSALMSAGLRVWARCLLLPSRALRKRLVVARRSSGGRSRLMNLAILNAKRAQALRAGQAAPARKRS